MLCLPLRAAILDLEPQQGLVFSARVRLKNSVAPKPKPVLLRPPGKGQGVGAGAGGSGRASGTQVKVLTSGTVVTYEKWKLTGKTAGGREGKK